MNGGNIMISNTVKKLVSVIACMSVLFGYTLKSNAYSAVINSGSSVLMFERNCASGPHNYNCNVSYVKFDGLAEGNYYYGLKVRATKGITILNICSINSMYKSGTYIVPSAGTYSYRLYNQSDRKVTIQFSFS